MKASQHTADRSQTHLLPETQYLSILAYQLLHQPWPLRTPSNRPKKTNQEHRSAHSCQSSARIKTTHGPECSLSFSERNFKWSPHPETRIYRLPPNHNLSFHSKSPTTSPKITTTTTDNYFKVTKRYTLHTSGPRPPATLHSASTTPSYPGGALKSKD